MCPGPRKNHWMWSAAIKFPRVTSFCLSVGVHGMLTSAHGACMTLYVQNGEEIESCVNFPNFKVGCQWN